MIYICIYIYIYLVEKYFFYWMLFLLGLGLGCFRENMPFSGREVLSSFLILLEKFTFYQERLGTRLQFGAVLRLLKFPNFLISLWSFGNSWDNSYIYILVLLLIKTFFFTYGEIKTWWKMQVSLSSATVSNLFMGYRSKQHMSWIAMITTSFSTPYLKQKIEFRLTLFCEKMFVLLGFLKKILNLQAICLAQKTLSPPPTKNPHNSIKKKNSSSLS